MSSSELRKQAREALRGKWGKAVLLTLSYLGITIGINFVLMIIPLVGLIASFVISPVITHGFFVSMMKLRRGETVKNTGFLTDGFANFKRVWCVLGYTIKKMLLPIILIVVFAFLTIGSSVGNAILRYSDPTASVAGLAGMSAILMIGYIASIIYMGIKSLLYTLTSYILYDNPNMTNKEIVEESEKLMKGNRLKAVWLIITFIGWILLSAFTMYIGLLWVAPYVNVAMVCFYEVLANKKTEVIELEKDPIQEKY